MQQMTHAMHSQLGINVTTTQQQITHNELVDALDNLANAATSQTDLAATQLKIIKTQQSTIECLPAKNTQLLKIVDTLSHCHLMSNTNSLSTTSKQINGNKWGKYGYCWSMNTKSKGSHQHNVLQDKRWPQVLCNSQQHHGMYRGYHGFAQHSLIVNSTIINYY